MVNPQSFPGDAVVKNLPANAGNMRRGFHPWVGKIPWRRAWQPTAVFLPGESQRQRSLVGYSPSGHRVEHDWSRSARTHAHTQVFSIHLLIHIDFWHLGRLGISELLALCKQILEMSVDVGMSGKWPGSRRPEEREAGGQGYLFLRDGRGSVLTSGNTEGGVTLREYRPVFLLTASKLFCFSLLKALGFAPQGSIV